MNQEAGDIVLPKSEDIFNQIVMAELVLAFKLGVLSSMAAGGTKTSPEPILGESRDNIVEAHHSIVCLGTE